MPRKMRVARAEEFWVEALVADSQRVKARVRAVEKLGGQVVIGLDVKDWVGARSGQFAMLQPVRSRCFLPRAFSVFTGARGGATGIVNFLIAPVGRGTEELAAMREGEEVWVLGPRPSGPKTQTSSPSLIAASSSVPRPTGAMRKFTIPVAPPLAPVNTLNARGRKQRDLTG